jgi:hypothetical protein
MPCRCFVLLILCFSFLLGSGRQAYAQDIDPLPVDTLPSNRPTSPRIHSESQILKETDGSKSRDEKNAEFYSKIKTYSSRHKLLDKLYGVIFREPPQGAQPVQPDASNDLGIEHQGKYIRSINVKRLPVFGPSVNDTARVSNRWLGKVGNRLHTNTQRYVINNDLMFRKGSLYNQEALLDNERVLRQRPNLIDARIIAIPTEHPDSVDLMVITQDVWSLYVDGGVLGTTRADLVVGDLNFLGMGHHFRNMVNYDRSPGRGWGYRGIYTVPYIGNTFTTGQAEVAHEWFRQYYGIRLDRQFVTPATKWAGGLEVSRQRLLGNLAPLDTTGVIFPFSYNLGDIWLARALPVKFGSPEYQDRTRFVLAGRVTGMDYKARPLVLADSNQLFRDRLGFKASFGISERRYFRDVLVYGFGRTEDIPYGNMFNITTGFERHEFGNRMYAGVEFANGRYHNRLGYWAWHVGVGSFFDQRKAEQGAVMIKSRYFSRLITLRNVQLRQFINFRTTYGLSRFDGEFIDLNQRNGMTGISSPWLLGNKRAALNLETVLFTPYNLLGFRAAFFSFADLGVISSTNLWESPIYQAYGVGVRLRNEHLALNTFQVRLVWYPNIPGNAIPLRTAFDGIPVLRIEDFHIGAPQPIPFR